MRNSFAGDNHNFFYGPETIQALVLSKTLANLGARIASIFSRQQGLTCGISRRLTLEKAYMQVSLRAAKCCALSNLGQPVYRTINRLWYLKLISINKKKHRIPSNIIQRKLQAERNIATQEPMFTQCLKADQCSTAVRAVVKGVISQKYSHCWGSTFITKWLHMISVIK